MRPSPTTTPQPVAPPAASISRQGAGRHSITPWSRSTRSGSGSGSGASDIVGTVSAASVFNLVGTGGAGGMKNNVNGNIVGVSSTLLQTTLGTLPVVAGPVGNNGGPTDTVALLAGSPAIDKGTAFDPRRQHPDHRRAGAVRGPLGLDAGATPDIGAYEASSSFVVTSAANTFDAGTLPTAVSWADFSTNANPANPTTNPAPNTIVFDTTGLFSSPQTINLNGVTLSLTNVKDANTGVAINGPGGGIVTISGNQAGGVFMVPTGATVTLSGITITGGSAADGGAVDNFGNLTVTNATITGNTATNGGGIDNENGGTLQVVGSTFSNNSATNQGGGIANNGTATLTNSTLAGNTASLGGGVWNGGTLTTVNVTIAYNSVTSGGMGGGLDQASGTALLYNTIVALNAGGDISGTISSASAYNLIGVPNPGLAPGLANNGGPTETIALLAGSPALDAGSSQVPGAPSTDQRGAVRGRDARYRRL